MLQTYNKGSLPGHLHCSTEKTRKTSVSSADTAAWIVDEICIFPMKTRTAISNATHLHDKIHKSPNVLLIKPDNMQMINNAATCGIIEHKLLDNWVDVWVNETMNT